MSTIHRTRRVALAIAALLVCALAIPLAVTAEQPDAASWDDMSGYGSVESSRAAASRLLAGDPTWDETSGYGAVEAIRAGAVLAPVERTNQVSSDVRWAPALMIEADLGSGQGGLRAADLAAARAWDETSGYSAVEASRAAASALIGSSCQVP